jgi:hypothetical protein
MTVAVCSLLPLFSFAVEIFEKAGEKIPAADAAE